MEMETEIKIGIDIEMEKGQRSGRNLTQCKKYVIEMKK